MPTWLAGWLFGRETQTDVGKGQTRGWATFQTDIQTSDRHTDRYKIFIKDDPLFLFLTSNSGLKIFLLVKLLAYFWSEIHQY